MENENEIENGTETETENKIMQFYEMDLDDRILKGIAKLGWNVPTLIQEKSIPLILEGKDVLLKGRTGSGKTAAFAIPIVQNILTVKKTILTQETSALILAPTRELCHQIYEAVKCLTVKCSREVQCVDIAPAVDLNVQKPLLLDKPDIVVGTPSRTLRHIKAGNLNLTTSLQMLVVDEADLIFSFGYETEIHQLISYLPKIFQSILSSATLSEDVKNLKNLILHNPVTLKLEEPEMASSSQLTHYHLLAEEIDKATILYALFKLHLIRGKTILFVNTVDKCYKLKLYLEQYGIPTCVLNSELPATIRCHSVGQFNKGIYDIIIASDEKVLDTPGSVVGGVNIKGKRKRKKDKESGVSRGIDFQFVSNVINFDFPLDTDAYIHRAGRTARGTNEGNVLSFISMREKLLFEAIETNLKESQGESFSFKSYNFKLNELESFKYRARDAWKAVTRIAIREARLKEIKQEIFNCQKLKAHFEDNPSDLQVLRHDKALHTVKIHPHLTDVPDYIIPNTLKSLTGISKPNNKRKRSNHRMQKSNSKYLAKRNNPLLNMDVEKWSKKKKQ